MPSLCASPHLTDAGTQHVSALRANRRQYARCEPFRFCPLRTCTAHSGDSGNPLKGWLAKC